MVDITVRLSGGADYSKNFPPGEDGGGGSSDGKTATKGSVTWIADSEEGRRPYSSASAEAPFWQITLIYSSSPYVRRLSKNERSWCIYDHCSGYKVANFSAGGILNLNAAHES